MAVTSKTPATSSLLVLAAATMAAALVFLAGPAAATGKTGQVTVFWGRNKAEGSLREACDTGTYTIVVISFLRLSVSNNKPPTLDISGHPTAGIGADIKHCQSKSIMVFLSLAAGDSSPLPSAKAAADLADYLWYAYFPAQYPRAGVRRPFGDAYVDGLDFFFFPDAGHGHGGAAGSPDYYDVLASRLWSYNKQFRARTPVQLSATPPCAFPPPPANRRGVRRLLATGLVTRVNVRFYGDDGHCAAYWQQEWDKWTAAFPGSSFYVGLPASEKTVGYVHPKNLYYGVVPVVQKAANYGGIMVWDRFADKQSNYSGYAIQWA